MTRSSPRPADASTPRRVVVIVSFLALAGAALMTVLLSRRGDQE